MADLTINGSVEAVTISTETLAALFHRTTRLMARVHHMQGHARHAQNHILAILSQRESISQRELLEELNVRSASLSELLSKLERGGLVTRERDEEDRRSVIVTVTEQGKAQAASLGDERNAGAEALFAPLSDAEKQQLGELLIKILVDLEEKHPELAHAPHSERGRFGRHECGYCEREHPGRGHHGHGHPERERCGRHERGRFGHHDRPDERCPGRGPHGCDEREAPGHACGHREHHRQEHGEHHRHAQRPEDGRHTRPQGTGKKSEE